jgi:hypothetical protein
MKILVGNTGLVGKTLTSKVKFDRLFNSSNIEQFNNISNNNDELYLSCLSATKWMIDKNLKQDLDNINSIIDITRNKRFSRIVLFSTIDVYRESPLCVDEDYDPNISKLSYGNNRYYFELMVSSLLKYDDIKIFRLPSLFNMSIKKNIIFDLLNRNNIDQINLNSAYQWYNLDNLSKDISEFIENNQNEKICNLFPEPIETDSIVRLFPEYQLSLHQKRIEYNYKTKFTKSGYIQQANSAYQQIQEFVNEYRSK